MRKAAWNLAVRSACLAVLAIAVRAEVTSPVRQAAQEPVPAATRLQPQAPSFTRDVAPILQRHCQVCHRPGMMAPMSLLTFEETRPWAGAIKRQVAAREMPPWHVDRNIGIQKFKDDPSLTDAEIATIVNWVDGGALEGDPADMLHPPAFEDAHAWHIGEPDLIVTMPDEHLVAARGADDFFKPIADSGLTEDRYIRAVETRPGAPMAVHHALTYLVGDPEHPDNATKDWFLNEYAIGKNGDIFPEGSGRLLKAGAKIRFDLHYHSCGMQARDRTQVGFVFYPKGYVPRHVQHAKALAGTDDLDIPGGDPNARTDGYHLMPGAARITAYQPHMHNRGKAQCLEAIYPDGRVDTLNCVRFHHGWHIVYNYADEAAPLLPAHTTLHLMSWHDNSAANKLVSDPRNWVGYGQRAVDEMSFAWISWYDLTDEEYEQEAAVRANRSHSGAASKGFRVGFRSTGLSPAKPTSGADVVPEFDGWERNPDGTFNVVFGYMNRNSVEEPIVPIGPDNHIEPGGPDRGQPTYFYPRLNRFVFRVKVPNDFRELVWTLTAHGRTERAYATLAPDLEIDRKIIVANTVMVGSERAASNQPPSLTVDPIPAVTPGNRLTLTASVRDDGLPVARGPAGLLSVSWMVYRGPGKVSFRPEGSQRAANPGAVRSTARFREPGRYVLRAVAFDGMLQTTKDVPVWVPARRGTRDRLRVRRE